MKDQVDAMLAMGVPATCLNSTLSPADSAARTHGLDAGRYRLLYAAPERLMMPGFTTEMARWNPVALAIDEAHCISEWGHDFRPEYRQLARLREEFPHLPVLALTATATTRVRDDIIRQLKLRDPACHVASFNRPNLTYSVHPKSRPMRQALEFVQSRPNDSGIIYCQSRKGTESVAAELESAGIRAAPYHAGMQARDRDRNQELFLRDEVRVICATIAFGMGINKPNVRFVLHYDLPKNIEGYYQETGRAGRDGLPAECLLLFGPGDAVRQHRFIDEKPDPREQEIARGQLQRMIDYAGHSGCRRALLLGYFGEQPPAANCGGCDNCLAPRENFDATRPSQMLLSCVYRIRRRSGTDLGLSHVVDVLLGGDTTRIRKWGHQQLSTYGIGTEFSRMQWQHIAHELLRKGYLRQVMERHGVLQLTPEGEAILTSRRPIELSRPAVTPEPVPRRPEGEHDDALFESLRRLRKRIADEMGVPPYIVFSDSALHHMARQYPRTPAEFSRIPGVGRRKLEDFSEPFLAAIAAHLLDHQKQGFATTAEAGFEEKLNDTALETWRRLQTGASIHEIATVRNLNRSTIAGHIEKAIEAGAPVEPGRFFSNEDQELLERAFTESGGHALTPVKERLGDRFDFEVLRLFRAFRKRRPATEPGAR
jgi:ATP-dependent DNA helicase RecQ